jgi:hypothetical protein
MDVGLQARAAVVGILAALVLLAVMPHDTRHHMWHNHERTDSPWHFAPDVMLAGKYEVELLPAPSAMGRTQTEVNSEVRAAVLV